MRREPTATQAPRQGRRLRRRGIRSARTPTCEPRPRPAACARRLGRG